MFMALRICMATRTMSCKCSNKAACETGQVSTNLGVHDICDMMNQLHVKHIMMSMHGTGSWSQGIVAVALKGPKSGFASAYGAISVLHLVQPVARDVALVYLHSASTAWCFALSASSQIA